MKRTKSLLLAGGLFLFAGAALAITYTYTVNFENSLNIPITVKDGDRVVTTIPKSTQRTLTFSNSGNTIAVEGANHNLCHQSFNLLDLRTSLDFGTTKYFVRLTGNFYTPDNYELQCVRW